MNRLRLSAALVLSSGFLVACGGGSESSSEDTSPEQTAAAPAADPATGEEQTTDDFTFLAPDGWEFKEGLAPQALAFAVDIDDSDGFADNVNVVADDTIATIDDVDDLGKAAKTGLESAQAKEVTIGEPINLDGETAATVTSLFSLNGVEYRTLQFAVGHGDKGFVVTFSYSEDVPADEQAQVAESVAATWAWAA